MSVRVQCASCGHQLKLSDSMIGKRVKCPSCEKPISVSSGKSKTPQSQSSTSSALPGKRNKAKAKPKKKKPVDNEATSKRQKPSKKKSKKEQPSKLLIPIVSVVGVAFLGLVIWGVSSVVSSSGGGGGAQKETISRVQEKFANDDSTGKTTSEWIALIKKAEENRSNVMLKMQTRNAGNFIGPDPAAFPALLDAVADQGIERVISPILAKFESNENKQPYVQDLIDGTNHEHANARSWSVRLMADRPDAADQLVPVLENVIEANKDDGRIVNYAIQSAGAMGDSGTPILLKAFAVADQTQKYQILTAISPKPPAAAFSILAQLADGNSLEDKAVVLIKTYDEQSLPPYEQLSPAINHTNDEVKLTAIHLLRYHPEKGDEIVSQISDLLDNEGVGIQNVVVETMATLSGTADALLKKRFEKESGNNRRNTIAAIISGAGESGTQMMKSYENSEQIPLKLSALYGLASNEHPIQDHVSWLDKSQRGDDVDLALQTHDILRIAGILPKPPEEPMAALEEMSYGKLMKYQEVRSNISQLNDPNKRGRFLKKETSTRNRFEGFLYTMSYSNEDIKVDASLRHATKTATKTETSLGGNQRTRTEVSEISTPMKVHFLKSKIGYEGHFESKLPTGKWVRLYEDGTPWIEGNYFEGVRNGDFVVFDKQGKKVWFGQYKDGELDDAYDHFR